MPYQRPYVNHAYWTQLSMFHSGFEGLFQRFTVAMHGPDNRMSCSVELFTDEGPGWVELEGPIFKGGLAETRLLTNVMMGHIHTAQEYLKPF